MRAVGAVALFGAVAFLGVVPPGAAPAWAAGRWDLMVPPAECRGQACRDAPAAPLSRWTHAGGFDSVQGCERARWARTVDALLDHEAHLTALEAARTAPREHTPSLDPLFHTLAVDWGTSRGDRSFWLGWRLRWRGPEREALRRATWQFFRAISWEEPWRVENEEILTDSWRALHSRCLASDDARSR